MRKNLIFLTLLISVLMISVVSAGITGYLTARGGGIRDASGYTATLQKVEGTTAIVSVQTPTGDTELVRVAEGETAKVGDATISASDLTRGTLFSRSGANVKIDVPSASGTGERASIGGVAGTSGQCVTQNCQWEFNTTAASPVGGEVGVKCNQGEIVFESSCQSSDPQFIKLSQGFTNNGNNWRCNFVVDNEPPPYSSGDITAGALCCSV